MKSIPIITIDGLSGSGKGTISKMLCIELGWNILDSGALYRTLAYLMEKHFGILMPRNFEIEFSKHVQGQTESLGCELLEQDIEIHGKNQNYYHLDKYINTQLICGLQVIYSIKIIK